MIILCLAILTEGSKDYEVSGDGKRLTVNTTFEITPQTMKDSGGQESYTEIDVVKAPSIAASAFSGCSKLEVINLCDSISSIGSSAFSKCANLRSITIPLQTTEILSSTFYECSSLKNITIHENVNKIATSSCFQGCTSLAAFIVSRSNTVYKTDDSMKCLISNDGLTLYVGTCGQVKIPQKIRIFAPFCLYRIGVKSVVFPDDSDLVEIQENSFGFTNIDVLKFPNKLEKIIKRQFNQAYINEVVFPDSLISIPDNLLEGSYSVGKMTFNNETSKVLMSINGVIYDRDMTTIFLVSESATSITIPSKVEQIAQELVRNRRILSVEVSPGNTNLSSYKGVLYDNKTEVLIACPGGRLTVNVAPTCKSFYKTSFQSCLVQTIVFEGTDFEEVGSATFDYCYSLVTMELPSSLKRIYNYGFEHCTAWKGNIKLNDNITHLKSYAFTDCQSLESIDLSECSKITTLESRTFSRCGLRWIKFPPQIVSIQESCFLGCVRLASIEIPSTVTSISTGTFSGCSVLQSINFSTTTIDKFDKSLFENSGLLSIRVPDNITSIESNCFKGCSELASIIFGPNSRLERISPNMVYGCKSLQEIELPSTISTIQLDTFANSQGLQSIFIRNRMTINDNYWSDNGVLMKNKTLIACPGGRKSYSVTGSISDIASHAFYMCSNLNTLLFTSSCTLTKIADSTFYGCSSLQILQLPNGLSSVDKGAFNGCSGLVSVSFGVSIQTLADSCFSGCTNLEQVDFGSSSFIQTLGSSVFAGCEKLRMRDNRIPDSVRKIGASCFEGCHMLELESLPPNITEIGPSAFRGCLAIRTVRLPDSLRALGVDSFSNCSNLSAVRFCGISSPIEQDASSFSGSPVGFVMVSTTFHGDRFGDLPVRKILDNRCNIPTVIFTSASGGKSLIGTFLQSAIINSETRKDSASYPWIFYFYFSLKSKKPRSH